MTLPNLASEPFGRLNFTIPRPLMGIHMPLAIMRVPRHLSMCSKISLFPVHILVAPLSKHHLVGSSLARGSAFLFHQFLALQIPVSIPATFLAFGTTLMLATISTSIITIIITTLRSALERHCTLDRLCPDNIGSLANNTEASSASLWHGTNNERYPHPTCQSRMGISLSQAPPPLYLVI
ncbi:uncharacterized protein ASPGLDRAFT_437086 [Aspergillus glaucus CBS 516.65]|uniref:Uncharacterized protein n=1 Tax=Aspergillus glaucus CBS 516.65 TaxID=1160497 RepID=A0A1L9VGE1_ASPGL|nr:hypothetical protein ASPGLDRAFT_437086 [Aspergillus glaucus CBS 516.65]OJJ82973.1 hypothetical protein ASPGLDRAFT_437086 [Aspergillus glaucus CBS 516.65]